MFILYSKSLLTMEILKEGKRFYSAMIRKEICLRPLYDHSCTSQRSLYRYIFCALFSHDLGIRYLLSYTVSYVRAFVRSYVRIILYDRNKNYDKVRPGCCPERV